MTYHVIIEREETETAHLQTDDPHEEAGQLPDGRAEGDEDEPLAAGGGLGGRRVVQRPPRPRQQHDGGESETKQEEHVTQAVGADDERRDEGRRQHSRGRGGQQGADGTTKALLQEQKD